MLTVWVQNKTESQQCIQDMLNQGQRDFCSKCFTFLKIDLIGFSLVISVLQNILEEILVWGCITAHSLHKYEGTIEVFKRHMLPSRWRLFPGGPWLFQQDNTRPHAAKLRGFIDTSVNVLDWHACSPDLSPHLSFIKHTSDTQKFFTEQKTKQEGTQSLNEREKYY